MLLFLIILHRPSALDLIVLCISSLFQIFLYDRSMTYYTKHIIIISSISTPWFLLSLAIVSLSIGQIGWYSSTGIRSRFYLRKSYLLLNSFLQRCCS